MRREGKKAHEQPIENGEGVRSKTSLVLEFNADSPDTLDFFAMRSSL